MLKDNMDSKFDFIGTFEPHSPLAEIFEDQTSVW